MNDDKPVMAASPPAPVPQDDEAIEMELELLDKVATAMFPFCVQLSINKGGITAPTGEQKLHWNLGLAAMNAFEAAATFLHIRRGVLDQFPARRAAEVEEYETKKRVAAARAGKPN